MKAQLISSSINNYMYRGTVSPDHHSESSISQTSPPFRIVGQSFGIVHQSGPTGNLDRLSLRSNCIFSLFKTSLQGLGKILHTFSQTVELLTPHHLHVALRFGGLRYATMLRRPFIAGEAEPYLPAYNLNQRAAYHLSCLNHRILVNLLLLECCFSWKLSSLLFTNLAVIYYHF